MVISNYQQEILLLSGEQTPNRGTPAGSGLLQSLGFSSLCISSAASFFPPLPSHAKAPVCVKQTHFYLPLRPRGQSSDTQSVPKVRRLNWGAASKFCPVYTTVPQKCYLHKSWKPQQLLLFDSTQPKALPHTRLLKG